MQNRPLRFGPVALSNTLTTNILNCNVTSLAGPVGFTLTQPYLLITHMRAVNKTGSPVTVSLWIGATGGKAAGTEVAWPAPPIPAKSYIHRDRGLAPGSADPTVICAAPASDTLQLGGGVERS